MAGRKAGFRHSEDTRKKIQAGVLIDRLMKHVQASTPLLDASQVNAAKALLAKVLPDLQSTEMKHDLTDGMKDLLAELNGKQRRIPTAS